MADRTPLSPEIQRLADAFRGDGRGPHFASSECEPGCPACGYLAIYHDLLALQSRLDEAERQRRLDSGAARVSIRAAERRAERAEAQVAALRETLEEIESFPISGYHAGAAQRIARGALAVSDGGGDEPPSPLDKEIVAAIEACPDHVYHETHRYCPSCPWTEELEEQQRRWLKSQSNRKETE